MPGPLAYGFTISAKLKPEEDKTVHLTVYWWPLFSRDPLLAYYSKHPDFHPVEPIPTSETGALLVKRGTCSEKRLQEFMNPEYWKDALRGMISAPFVVEERRLDSSCLPCTACATNYFRRSERDKLSPLAFHLLLTRLNKIPCRHLHPIRQSQPSRANE